METIKVRKLKIKSCKSASYDNIWKIATGQGDDYTTGCLLDYIYFKKHYKLIAIDLSKQQAQYNNLDVKLSNSQLNKFKSGIKNGTGVTLKISSSIEYFIKWS